jgi:flavin-dependent dehydrogenase
VLIGAGGHHCPVARLLNGAEPHGAGLVLAQVTEFRLQGEDARRCRVEPGVPMLSFCRDRAGYGWCLRKGDYLNVGFGRLSGPDFAAHLAAFREWVQGAVLHGIGVPGRWQGHAYRVWHAPQRRMVGDAVLLAGDAAGLADPVSGEGISAAIESGRMAAFYLLSAGGHYSREALAPYARAVTARLGEPRSAGGPPAGLAAVLTAAVGRALLRSPRFLRHIVLERWFLHRSRKPFGFPPIGNAM